MGIVDAARACTAARLSGLMCCRRPAEHPDQSRPYFRELRAVRERLLARGSGRVDV